MQPRSIDLAGFAPRRPAMRVPALAGSVVALSLMAGSGRAQQPAGLAELPPVNVSAPAGPVGYATQPQFHTDRVSFGPLGSRSILETPASVTTVPEDLITNVQAQGVNDVLRYLPSVQIRDQQGTEVTRPQSRGFQGSIAQNTRLDGLNIIGTTAIAAENLAGVQEWPSMRY